VYKTRLVGNARISDVADWPKMC